MNEIAELERRISTALTRIGQGIDAVLADLADGGHAGPAAPGDGSAAEAELREALDAERAANAQLTERVRAIKEKQETMVGALETKVARLTRQLDAAGLELQRHKRLNADLTEANRALGEAAREGLTEPHLINRSMMTELEALRVARATEVAEIDEILSELKPLIGEVA